MITLGIDFGGTSIKLGVTNDGKIIDWRPAIETQNFSGPDEIIAAILAGIKETLNKHPKIKAIGMGLPGLVDSRNGIVRELTNVPGWRDVPLLKIISDATKLPAIIENDANAMAYGEWKYGAAKNKSDVVCITLGTGIGGGLILNNQLYRGAKLGAGEIGHIHFDPEGPAASYGNTGAVEKLSGNREIMDRMKIIFGSELDDPTPAGLTKLADAGDERAIRLWEEVGYEIGVVLSSVVWLLNPDAIVIGGGVAKAGRHLFDVIRKTISGRVAKAFSEDLLIVPAALGNDAGIIGCATMAADSISGLDL